jgi:glycosyltransferase involved in cell wall biosynthesis
MLAVNVVVPVYNGSSLLVRNIRTLHSYLSTQSDYSFQIIIANNGSSDESAEIATHLATQFPHIEAIEIPIKGRGRALKRAWGDCTKSCQVLAYMDLDLSTELSDFPKLVGPLLSGDYDLAVGSRLLESSKTIRGIRREVISRTYNLLVKLLFRTKFSDAQCGFKAITAQAAEVLLPLVEDNNWFMDTELLVLAERLNYKIFDFPVCWVENTDSRVRVIETAFQNIRALLRLRKSVSVMNSPANAQQFALNRGVKAMPVEYTSVEVTSRSRTRW